MNYYEDPNDDGQEQRDRRIEEEREADLRQNEDLNPEPPVYYIVFQGSSLGELKTYSYTVRQALEHFGYTLQLKD